MAVAFTQTDGTDPGQVNPAYEEGTDSATYALDETILVPGTRTSGIQVALSGISNSLLAIIAKYGFPISELALLYQALLRCL